MKKHDTHYSDAQKEEMIKKAYEYINSMPKQVPEELVQTNAIVNLMGEAARIKNTIAKFPGTRWIIEWIDAAEFGEKRQPAGYLLGLFLGGRVVTIPTMDLGLLATIIYQNKEI